MDGDTSSYSPVCIEIDVCVPRTMGLSGFYGILYYGILASLTGGYLPVRAKNLWLTFFHLFLFIAFLVSPLIVYFVSVCARLTT